MTRPHAVTHRAGCSGPMKPPSRVGPWLVARCAGCGATEVRPIETTPQTKENTQ